jgi:hypothetical protein
MDNVQEHNMCIFFGTYIKVNRKTMNTAKYLEIWEECQKICRRHCGHYFTDHVTDQYMTQNDSLITARLSL